MKRSYTIKQFRSRENIDWDEVNVAPVDFFGWIKDGISYTPKTEARLAFVPGDGFYFKLTAFEKNPRAVCKKFGDMVCRDSCLEFFAAFDRSKPDYINFEFNSLGTAHIATGAGRKDRVMIDSVLPELPEVVADRLADCWSVTSGISLDALKLILGVDGSAFHSGYSFGGNFYKCGDDTEIEHYGMWNPCCTDHPDFHRPECFGELVIE